MNVLWRLAGAACFMVTALSAPSFGQSPGSDPYAAVMKRDFGTAIDEMTSIEHDIEAATPDQYPGFEDHLIAIVSSPDATKPGKQFACQMLRIVGSLRCVPAVAALLTDEQLSHIARYVLLPMHTPAADTALRQALVQTQGAVRIGIINTLGDRRDTVSIKPIAMLVDGPDEMTGRAALNAIGKIGGVPAAATLDRLKPPTALSPAWALAYLHVAENLVATGDKARADKMLRRLLTPSYPAPVRAAALSSVAQIEKEKSAQLVFQSFGSDEAIMRRAAVTAVIGMPGHPATAAFTRMLPTISNGIMPSVLAALAARGDGAGLTSSVNRLAASPDPAVRKAAVVALGSLGDSSSVPVLTALLKDADSRRDATRALTDIRGPGAGAAMMQSADRGDPETRSALMAVLAQRGRPEALPSFRSALADPDSKVRSAAIAGLSALGTLEDMTPLAVRVASATDDSEREELGGAMTAIGLRTADESARSAPALQALTGASPAAKVQLLAVLSSLAGDRAYQAVQAALAEGGDVHNAALRGLAEWPTGAPMTLLRTAAKDEPDRSNRVVALRGYIRLVGVGGLQPGEKVQAYRDAIAMAERPDEKRQAVGGLAETRSVEALKVIQPLLDDADVKNEAYLAYERIAESLVGRDPQTAREALQRVVDSAPDDRLKNRARAALDRIR